MIASNRAGRSGTPALRILLEACISMRGIAMAACAAFCASFFPAGAACGQGSGEQGTVRKATVWFLDHSGFAVRTAKHFLVFDCRTDDPAPGGAKGLAAGVIDFSEIRDLQVVVFVSHGHGDHFNPALLRKWRKECPTAVFVMPKGLAGMSRGLAQDLGARLVEAESARIETVGGATFLPITATDDGLGYLVKVEGVALFHSGDHALWAKELTAAFEGEIGKVKEHGPVDIAFLALHSDHPNMDFVFRGAVWAADALKPAAVVPMHLFGKLGEGDKFAKIMKERNCHVPCVVPKARGQRFEFDSGVLRPAESGAEGKDWTAMLKAACKGDAAFLAQIQEAAGSAFPDPAFDEASWKEKRSVTEIPAGDSAQALSGPARFYVIDGGVFGIGSMPSTILTVGLREDGRACLIAVTIRRWEAAVHLAGFLKPVTSESEAVQAAALAARLIVYCKRCNLNVRVDPAKCSAAAGDAGGFVVSIPAEASSSKSRETAKVVFAKDGKLADVEFEPCRHR